MDKVSSEIRSKMMSAVRGKDTAPERLIRSKLFSAGYRYRLHSKRLPGAPDIVLPKFMIVVFVHGCFWHGHHCRKGRQRPASNTKFWNKKLDGNLSRDKRNIAALRKSGWRVVVIWECSMETGFRRLLKALKSSSSARSSKRIR